MKLTFLVSISYVYVYVYTLTNGLEYGHYNQLQGRQGGPQLLQERHTSLVPLNAALLIAAVSAAGEYWVSFSGLNVAVDI